MTGEFYNERDLTPETPLTEGDRFRSFSLDPKTEEAGYSLSDANIMVIRNLISGHAHDCFNLQYDENQPHRTAIQKAYIVGAIEALEHLLNCHREITVARQQLDSQ